jgi:hypothetical protein
MDRAVMEVVLPLDPVLVRIIKKHVKSYLKEFCS